ncbi:helix-turn-helix domain-containing protein [Duganella sp. BJB488]|uniref:helix-turn-helix domain-containing protein n=1 Tax=unclassified Duganella TaxID=2636909 RepID=UPI000E3502F6|nr:MULTISPECIES: helix-turn-helix domain-containing protein [unclassified Duganella]NVD71895.1 helix-turn-helix domain-containing protein [Duganella sp. BJB1802]RFP17938.1 helix-turn-helix domain-containing protein [Duganella sp. BJB489]RFP22397.1 helix-turn-helix domain-containing protein [Duganella sp. BJB488]RFP37609.1 helix-turn-helix domain-containing protein [Duganella sp. BJB480]
MTRNTKPAPPDVPQFALYGEQTRVENAEFVHIELIETRSRVHHWHIEKHTHAGLFQVLFLYGGEVRASVDGAVWECRAPAVITLHPSVVHGFDFSAEAHGYVLTVDQNVVFAVAENHGDLYSSLFVEPLMIDLSGQPELRARLESLLQNLLTEAAWPQYGHTLMLEWLARSALLLLVRLHAERRLADQSGRSDFELFSRFRAEVERRYKEQWQIGQYAEALRATPTRLNRLCLKLSGKSAFDITQDRLMLEACRKLTYLPSSIASIAYELGFQDPAYFSRLFKKRMGRTPKEFRAG